MEQAQDIFFAGFGGYQNLRIVIFTKRHGDEIVRLARNTEALERAEHPLQRIMAVERTDDRIVITTTVPSTKRMKPRR